jgi:hypothetical protein
VEDGLWLHQTAAMRQLDGGADQLSTHVPAHRVTDDLPVEQIDHGRQVQPALLRGQVGDIPDDRCPAPAR